LRCWPVSVYAGGFSDCYAVEFLVGGVGGWGSGDVAAFDEGLGIGVGGEGFDLVLFSMDEGLE